MNIITIIDIRKRLKARRPESFDLSIGISIIFSLFFFNNESMNMIEPIIITATIISPDRLTPNPIPACNKIILFNLSSY